jgi:hypothetical protein
LAPYAHLYNLQRFDQHKNLLTFENDLGRFGQSLLTFLSWVTEKLPSAFLSYHLYTASGFSRDGLVFIETRVREKIRIPRGKSIGSRNIKKITTEFTPPFVMVNPTGRYSGVFALDHLVHQKCV